jgi:hypothetical protein
MGLHRKLRARPAMYSRHELKSCIRGPSAAQFVHRHLRAQRILTVKAGLAFIIRGTNQGADQGI